MVRTNEPRIEGHRSNGETVERPVRHWRKPVECVKRSSVAEKTENGAGPGVDGTGYS